MKRNYKKAKQKKTASMNVEVIARIFEIAYLAGVAHFHHDNIWTDLDTKKMQERYNEFILKQKKNVPTK